jgi:acyl transferase domain-containing protein
MNEPAPADSVAIIGLACRYPGATNKEEYWRLIRDGVEVLEEASDAELRASGVSESLVADPNYVRHHSTLEGIEQFDAAFFGYSPREASLMDPQHRLFLETACQALDDAGLDPSRANGRIAVFGGTGTSEYYLNNLLPHRDELERSYDPVVLLMGNNKDDLTTRVAYKLNLRGPAVTVQSECSTSLVATCMGWQSLIDYQSDVVLVGGAYTPCGRIGHLYIPGAGGMLSPDGRCRSFDARAGGTRWSGGVGVAVLKRLEDALTSGDHIYAVIRGGAINNDGGQKVGYTAPGIPGQSEVIAEALAVAGVDAGTIGYVEAHGTATPYGDPVEITALTRAFRGSTDKTQYCAIGTVKANIGHTVWASGIAGLIKAALVLHHRELPPAVNFEEPNPEIDFANSPFYVNTLRSDWASDGSPRRAGVSAFGLGGTNAHVILEEAPAREASPASPRKHQVLAISAKSEAALAAASRNLAAHLQANPALPLADVAFTLLCGRQAWEHRRVTVAASAAEAAASLAAGDGALRGHVTSERAAAFVLPGVTDWSAEAAAGLYETEPAFRAQVDACCKGLGRDLGAKVRAQLRSSAEVRDTAPAERSPADAAALFVVEYGLGSLLVDWGIAPRALVAQGVGLLAAACLARVMSLEAALAALAWHVRGASSAKSAKASKSSKGKKGEAAAESSFPAMTLAPAATKIFDLDAGQWLTEKGAADPRTWERLLSESSDGAADLHAVPNEAHAALLALGPMPASFAGETQLCCLAAAQEPGEASLALPRLMAQFWAMGGSVAWEKYFAGEKRQRLSLPGYPFERQRCWVEPPARGQSPEVATPAAPSEARPALAATAERPSQLSTAYVAPTNDLENEIATMWQDLLGVKPVGIRDNFMELGGDSVLATRLVSRIRETYQIEVTVRALIEEGATVENAAALVARLLVAQAGGEEELASLLAELEKEK